jgi:hypothetical protein
MRDLFPLLLVIPVAVPLATEWLLAVSRAPSWEFPEMLAQDRWRYRRTEQSLDSAVQAAVQVWVKEPAQAVDWPVKVLAPPKKERVAVLIPSRRPVFRRIPGVVVLEPER